MKHLIIGFSAAGLSAVRTIREMDPGAEITVISDEGYAAYSRCLLTYMLDGRVEREPMYLLSDTEVEALNFVFKKSRASAVNPKDKVVVLENGASIQYDKLLIAAGAAPFIPRGTFDGIKGVFGLRSMEDAELIYREAGKAKSAVILGDGLVAVTAAAALRSRGLEVSLVGLADHILAGFLDEKASAIVANLLKQQGIKIYSRSTINNVKTSAVGWVTEVLLSDEKSLKADIIIVAAGIVPNIDLVKGSNIKADLGIIVNSHMETSVPDVYAAGDIAQGARMFADEPELVPLWPVAVEQGQVAGRNMAGVKSISQAFLAMNSVNISGVSVIAAGLSNVMDEGLETCEFVNEKKPLYRKMVFLDNRLVGYILVGNTKKAGILTALIKKERDISKIKNELCQGIFDYPKLSHLVF